MNGKPNRTMNERHSFRAPLIIAVVAALAVGAGIADAADAPAKPKASAQKVFATPDEAFQALADAAKANDSKTMAALLGPSGSSLIHSGDAVQDRRSAAQFAADYAEKHSLEKVGDAKATLVVGKDDWPLPIPAVKGTKGWTLDAGAGARELLARRIGQNELQVIQVMRAIVDAEQDYASEDRNGDGLLDYAGKFISTKGKKDGLYWPTKEGEPQSPLGPLVGEAAAEGYQGKAAKGAPYHGYHFRLLTGQGKDAPGGARSYQVHGRLLAGFAVGADPATYGNSGIMTFIVNQDGTVYQKDLGEKTATIAKAMTAYNPDQSWTIVK